MKQFTALADVPDVPALVARAAECKGQPYAFADLGRHRTLGLVFINPSLRTRMSTQRAAYLLGMQVMVLNVGQDGWQLEYADGAVMDGTAQEHIKDAVRVMSQYCDVLGVRSFAGLTDRAADYGEQVLSQFLTHATVPVISLESATRHPLQSLADLLTITEHRPAHRPKVVLTWAPHPKALPQAVPNSFAEWMRSADVDLVIAHPEGYDLADAFTAGVAVTHHQQDALDGADFVYAKNWSSYQHYGRVLHRDPEWTITPAKMARTRQAKFMHCLPVRRNVVVSDAVLDGPDSLILAQANNRTWAAMAVLRNMLETLPPLR